MKKSDIKVGVEYAMSHDQDHYRYPSSVSRVRVIEHTVVARDRWSSRGSGKPGVLVQLLDRETGEPMVHPVLDDDMEATGEMAVVEPRKATNRNIKEPWESFEATIKANKKAQAKHARQQAEHEAKQAAINVQIMEALQAAVPELNQHGYSAPYLAEYTIRDFLAGKKDSLELDQKTLAAIFGVEIPQEV